jgi:hypothetical protein
MLEGLPFNSYNLRDKKRFNINIKQNLDEEMKEELAGTTAICVIIKDKKIYCVSFLVLK